MSAPANSVRAQLSLLLITSMLAAAKLSADGALPSPPRKGEATEILWDTWGVPHIFGTDAPGLFRAFGWAQMQAHGDLILRLYGQARGRASEYWGKGYVASDRWVRTMGVPGRAGEWWAAQPPESRAHLEAFVEGMNQFAQEHPDQLAPEMRAVLPVVPSDVLAHSQRVILFQFVTSPDWARGQPGDWKKPGSNAWAIAPAHSTSGHAMLLANPHLPWSDHFTWFEAQLAAPGVDVYGATLVGSPFVGIGFNENLGWTHTVNTHDGADLYELSLVDGGYRWEGGLKAFETRTEILRVRQPDGSQAQEELVLRQSVQGPVVAERSGKALALRVIGLHQSGAVQQYWDMARARNLSEFERALKEMQLAMFTVIYADRDGHILHLFGGETPIRPAGSYDWAHIVPGVSSATLWTRVHPYADLPRVVDPPSGWLQNANDPPWTTTFPAVLEANRFPDYMAPRFMNFRAQRSARMLAEKSKLSFEEMVQDKFSTRMELADRLLDDLSSAVRSHPSDLAGRAIAVLEAWDRCADAGSRGAVLFEEFVRQVTERAKAGGPFAVVWNEKSPQSTPDGLADPAGAVAALETAAKKVESRHGKLDVAWGDTHHFRHGATDLPANGAAGDPLGVFRTIWYRTGKDGIEEAVGGDSFVAAVEFSKPLRARVVLSYGNASQPGSSHRYDQLPLLARKELRPAWRTRQEIEQHLESRKTF